MASRRVLFLKSQADKAKLAADGGKSRAIHKHEAGNIGTVIDVANPPKGVPTYSSTAEQDVAGATQRSPSREVAETPPQPETRPAQKGPARDKGKRPAAEPSEAPSKKRRVVAEAAHSPRRISPAASEPTEESSQGTSVLQGAPGGISWAVFKKTARTVDLRRMKDLKTQPRIHEAADALMKASQWVMGLGVYALALEKAQEAPAAEAEAAKKEAEELRLEKEAAEESARAAKAKWAEAEESLKKLGEAWERLEAAKAATEAKAAETETEMARVQARAEFEAAENARLRLELEKHSAVDCARRFQASAVYTQLLAVQSESDAEEARHLTVAQLKHQGLLDPGFDEGLINLAGDETGRMVEISAEDLAALESAPPIEEDEFFPLLGGADKTPAEDAPVQSPTPQEETEPHP